jgi:hypothetical protein
MTHPFLKRPHRCTRRRHTRSIGMTQRVKRDASVLQPHQVPQTSSSHRLIEPLPDLARVVRATGLWMRKDQVIVVLIRGPLIVPLKLGGNAIRHRHGSRGAPRFWCAPDTAGVATTHPDYAGVTNVFPNPNIGEDDPAPKDAA